MHEPNTVSAQESHYIDRAGIVASSLCALHCAAVGFFPSVIASLGLVAAFHARLEWGLTLIAVVFAGLACRQSWRRHRSWLAGTMFVVGISGLLLTRWLEGTAFFGEWTSLLSGAALVIGHGISIRASLRKS